MLVKWQLLGLLSNQNCTALAKISVSWTAVRRGKACPGNQCVRNGCGYVQTQIGGTHKIFIEQPCECLGIAPKDALGQGISAECLNTTHFSSFGIISLLNPN